MKIIVDNGSTKAHWCFADGQGEPPLITTDGINPVIQSMGSIETTLQHQLIQQIKALGIDNKNITNIHFYGAGCTDTTKDSVISMLMRLLGTEAKIEVESDLLAAARALCGHEEGIACILGTGSNSCFFDGEKIALHTPALGYILGDEGSGAVLGRKLLNALIKGTLPHSLCDAFLEETGLSVPLIINNVYKGTTPNRFLASTSTFVSRHLDDPQIEALVIDNFKDFIRKNILPYKKEGFPLNAVGSIAYHYNEQLQTAAQSFGLQTGKILKSPIYELANYHKED